MTSNDASLHLYGSFDLLNQLKKARLPLSRGEALLSPYLELGQYTRTKELVITDAEIDQEMNRQYQALPSHISQLLSFEDYQKQADKLMPAITEAILASRKAGRVSESGQYSIDKVCKVDYMSLCNSALSHYGWQTLAENYTGLCFALKADHPIFSSNNDRLALLKPVVYGAPHDFNLSALNPIPGFFNDHDENAPRQEWRAAYLFKEHQDFLKISGSAVQHIYVSVNASDEQVDSIKRLVTQDLRYRHVGVSMVLPDEQRWRLRVESI